MCNCLLKPLLDSTHGKLFLYRPRKKDMPYRVSKAGKQITKARKLT